MEAADEVSTRPPSWAEIYAAVPIERATKSIRLLTFHRDAQGNITGNLKAYNLVDCYDLAHWDFRLEWIALSYTWDSYELFEYDMRRRPDKGTYSISIQGVKVLVRENLWLAMNAILDQRDRHAQVGLKKQSSYMELINKASPTITSALSQDEALF